MNEIKKIQIEEYVKKQNLSQSDKEKLLVMLMEMLNRGLPLPALTNKEKLKWSVNPEGYFIKADGKEYSPTVSQKDFIKSTSARVAFIGGRGSGKTTSGSQKALRKIMEGKTGAVFNPDLENFKYSTWPELRNWIPWNMVVPKQRYRQTESWEVSKPFSMTFMNGAKMYCKGLRDPESGRGPNINWLWYDEAGRDKTGLGWQLATAGVRIGNDAQAWITTTPKGMSHWIYKFFVKQEFSDQVRKLLEETLGNRKLLEIFFGTIEENKENLTPDFYATMMASYSEGWLRSQELEGKFVDKGGTIGDIHWFDGKKLLIMPAVKESICRYWDLAASERKITGRKSTDPDSTVGTRVSAGEGRFVIEDQVAGQWLWHDIKKAIVQTAYLDGVNVPIYIEREPGAGGINQIAEIQGMIELAGYTVREHIPEGDKVQRANPWFARAKAGIVYYVEGDWNVDFLDQLDSFPTSNIHDDRVDSVSGCFAVLAPARHWRRIEFVHI